MKINDNDFFMIIIDLIRKRTFQKKLRNIIYIKFSKFFLINFHKKIIIFIK